MQPPQVSFASVTALVSEETETCDEKIWVDMLEELEFLVFSEPSTPAKAAFSLSRGEQPPLTWRPHTVFT